MQAMNPVTAYSRTQLIYDRELAVMLERAAREIRTRIRTLTIGIGGEVRKAQLNLVLAEIRKTQEQLWQSGVRSVLLDGRQSGARAAEINAETLQRVMYASLPEEVAETLSRGIQATAAEGIATDYARVPRELSARVYTNQALANRTVESTIRSGIIQGLSARELAQNVYKYVSPTAPGGQSYAAMRLARTEINNAFHQQQIAAAKRPGVTGVKWNLSGSHPKPDECNDFASRDSGMGPGVYKPNNVPAKPHPQCFCYLTYVTLTADQFKKGLARGDFDDELTRRIEANQRLVKPTPVKSAPAKRAIKAVSPPKAPVRTLAQSYAGGVEKRQPLGGGVMAHTDLVTMKDGTKAVRKTDRGYGWENPKDAQDAEELASVLGRGLGLHVPEVARISDDTILAEFAEGDDVYTRFASEIDRFSGDIEMTGEFAKLLESEEARRVVLFDAVIGNADRNAGNWLIDRGRVIPIDHGLAFQDFGGAAKTVESVTSQANSLAHPKLWDGAGSSAYSKADVQAIRLQVRAMRGEFTRLGHKDWYDEVLKRLDYLESKARGKGKMF
jgi:hypothetical protein